MSKHYFLLSVLLTSQISSQEINKTVDQAYEQVLLSAAFESLTTHKGNLSPVAHSLFSTMSEEQKNIRLNRKKEAVEYVEQTFSEYIQMLANESPFKSINKDAIYYKIFTLSPKERQEAVVIGTALETFIKMHK